MIKLNFDEPPINVEEGGVSRSVNVCFTPAISSHQPYIITVVHAPTGINPATGKSPPVLHTENMYRTLQKI